MRSGLNLAAISARLGGRTILENVSLAVPEGRVTVLVGPSGAGKTTLLRVAAGLLMPPSGHVLIGEEDVTILPAERRGCGVVFQSYALFPHLTVQENLEFPLAVRGVPKTTRRRQAREIAAKLRLETLLGRLPRQLSGGEKQRVALGRALVFRPRVLLLDEPLSALDPALAEELREEMAETLAAEKITTLLVTHHRQDALRLADRIAVMLAGRILQEGTPEEIYTRPAELFIADFFGAGARIAATISRNGSGPEAVSGFGRISANVSWTGPAVMHVRPDALRIAGGGDPNARIADVRMAGSASVAQAILDSGEAVRLELVRDQDVVPGARLRLELDPSRVSFFRRS